MNDAGDVPLQVGKITFGSSEARRRYYEGSGSPVPAPTDDEIADEIQRETGGSLGCPLSRDTLLAAARAVRRLFPTT